MRKLAKICSVISPSKTLEFNQKATQMKKQGIDVISLTVGEPDFATPDYIKEEAFKAINENFTRYTAVPGIVELREAIVEKYKNEFGVEYTINNVVVSNGAKQSLSNVIMAISEKGDEVIIPTPSWVSYPEMVNIAGAKPIIVPCDDTTNFKLTADKLKSLINDNTKAVILCSPSNPCGTIYTEEELREIAKVIKETGIYIIYDEIYEKLVYDGVKHFSMTQIEEIKEQVIAINGVSKAYAMTGWRIGYAIANDEISAACRKIQGHMTSSANSIAQKAATMALKGSQQDVENMRIEFDKRRKNGVEKLKEIPNVKIIEPKGAFYLFVDFSAYIGKSFEGKEIKDIDDLTLYFLNNLHVAAITGLAFGSEKHIRFSYACSIETMNEGIRRIKEGLEKLK